MYSSYITWHSLNNLSFFTSSLILNLQTPFKTIKGKGPKIPTDKPEDLKKFIQNNLIPKRNIDFSFYVAGNYGKSNQNRPKTIFFVESPSSYLQTLSETGDEVIESDHLSELFDDDRGKRGLVLKNKTFAVKEYNDSERERIEKLKGLIESEDRHKNHELYSFVFKITSSS